MALINKLNAIGDAIREKTGKSDLLTLEQMPVEIAAIETGGGSVELPEEAFKITGKGSYMFANNNWAWFLDMYGKKVTTEKLDDIDYMFYGSTNLKEIPFDLNCNNNTYKTLGSLFYGCSNLTKIGKIINVYPSNMQYMFYGCSNLRELPELVNLNMSRIYSYAYANIGSMFNGCYSLRRIPEDLLKQLYNPLTTNGNYTALGNGFDNCYTLDEIRGLNPQTGTITSNIFAFSFGNCHRVKDIIFATQEDGTPYSVNWKNQTLDLSKNDGSGGLGYATVLSNDGVLKCSRITDYNSGITMDKRISDATSYAALKDDPDWFAGSTNWCRYNHDSAVNTINSLPDTSAYLATAGGTNTIKFLGASGTKTDGGAINTLTEEEIAVATAKGWTVTLV